MTSPPRALCVEDEPDIREGLASLLEEWGYEVTTEGTAEDGLRQLQRRPFDLLITDFLLPAHNGAWMLSAAREEGLLSRTRVIMVTAVLELPALEGVEVLSKPIDVAALMRLSRPPPPASQPPPPPAPRPSRA